MIEKIKRAIENEIMRTGKMGTESVSVTVKLSEEEKEKFLNGNDYDNDHYYWEFEDSNLIITYTEDISGRL